MIPGNREHSHSGTVTVEKQNKPRSNCRSAVWGRKCLACRSAYGVLKMQDEQILGAIKNEK